MSKLNRRHFITGLTAAIGASSIAHLNANAVEVGLTYTPSDKNEFFDDKQMKIAARFVDIIIPDTDTPGAAKAGVHLYIDHLAGGWMNEEEKAVIIQGLNNLDAAAGAAHGKNFMALGAEAQVAIVQKMDDNRKTDKVYNTLKAYTVTGYYTSEIGGSQELRYDPFPGGYHEVLLKDVDRLSSS